MTLDAEEPCGKWMPLKKTRCCPGEKMSCGKCVRGLLCRSCNTALGHIERKSELARVYLANSPAQLVA